MQAIEGGMPIEAMVDLTGGLAERWQKKIFCQREKIFVIDKKIFYQTEKIFRHR